MAVASPLHGFRNRSNGVSPMVTGLFDLELIVAADGGLATVHHPGRSLDAHGLVELIRWAGGDQGDVRILAPVAEDHLPLLASVAWTLKRDVLVPPPGAELRAASAVPAPAEDAVGRGEEIVPVDAATRQRLDWRIVSPFGEPGPLSGWFLCANGRVRPRTGAVAIPLVDGGLALATRETFVELRGEASTMRPGHPGLLTVAVEIRGGRFLLGDYNAASWLADAPKLAASLATIPLYGANLRLWLSWPKATEERGRLRSGLAELAELTGATVWAPAEGGAVRVLPDSRDLGAVDRHGNPSVWESYGPAPVSGFESDLDGRLVPSGGIVTTSYPGVPLVSVPPGRERVMVARYARLTPSPGQFRIDLTILVDGRVACRYQDGSLLAVSARELGQRLRAAGWSGAPVALLAETAPERLDGVHQHLAEIGRQLGVTVSLETMGQPEVPGASAPSLPSSGDALPPPASLPAESLPPDELAPAPGQTTLVTVPGPALSASSAPLGSGRVKPDLHCRPPPRTSCCRWRAAASSTRAAHQRRHGRA